MVEKVNRFLESRYFMAVCLVLVAVTAFCLGRVSGLEERKEPVRVMDNRVGDEESSIKSEGNKEGEVKGVSTDSGQVVASKNGSKYHYPWCAGAQQISEKNKIFFASIEEARAAGYTPAANCKGLK